MNRWGRRDGIKLTHIPSGVSVSVWCDNFSRKRHYVTSVGLYLLARSWLAARLFASRNPEPQIRRTYYLNTPVGPRVKQGEALVAEGPGVFETLHSGTGLDRLMANARRASS